MTARLLRVGQRTGITLNGMGDKITAIKLVTKNCLCWIYLERTHAHDLPGNVTLVKIGGQNTELDGAQRTVFFFVKDTCVQISMNSRMRIKAICYPIDASIAPGCNREY